MQTFHDIVIAGHKLYEDTLRAQLEPTCSGKLLAVDVDSGAFAIGDDTLSAFDSLMEKAPAASVYLVRVGDSVALTLGAMDTR